ncbi:biosynthetic peptidoglycan transglycosylase [Variovorax fucosicus]|uniref:biosynthetic peptidoglycan transglycosylase n=1 Tax=Variovorax fucosicus TaxID=3053517 RepID=UPI0025791DC4|nr:biosynthetic peptidoglycan transglycosylase [Variovorax sp. J22G47]MDM0055127.1 biosynthetic peptidoglycan transglycosylase [Variovorax sp. J22G47]
MKKTLRDLLLVALALVATVAVAIVLIVKIALAPAAGEWSMRVKAGPVGFDVGVPTAIRLATASWFAPQLDGQTLDTRYGPVHFGWNEPRQTLELVCAPCSATVPELGAQPIKVDSLLITVRRDVVVLNGTLEAKAAGADAPALRGRWHGRLTQKTLQLDITMADAPIAQWYGVFVPALPELQRARIGGTMALHAQLALPADSFTIQPTISQFTVEGLGTEAMLNARSSCGAPSRLSAESWLARAVMAAEDQRFFQHPGYDLTELGAAVAANQKAGQVERGGSTLTQQLTKLLVTGSERTGERKLRELLYAVEMEQTLGKPRILQLYLDNAPWGSGVCGAEAAAKRYFKRSAARLEPAQAVWLAAMLHNPGAEIAQWQRTGNIDAARSKLVAEGIRGITRGQRESLLKSVANARFAPPP